MSDDVLSSHLSKLGCRTRQPAPWPSSQRQMFATVSWQKRDIERSNLSIRIEQIDDERYLRRRPFIGHS
jgi:hypothetical protein